MREIVSFLLSAYSYVFLYVLVIIPVAAVVEQIDTDDKRIVRSFKTVSIVLIPALIAWVINDFVLGSSSGLDDPNGARGVGPIEW